MTDYKEYIGRDWVDLLLDHPELSDILSEHCDWSKLSGFDWSLLLIHQPQFAERCDWNTLDGDDWIWLLASQPQFAKHCQWDKFDGDDWHRMLTERPQICNTEKLQLTAISETDKAFDLLFEPSARVRRAHELKWKL